MRVNIPQVGIVNFPDTMSPEEVHQTIATKIWPQVQFAQSLKGASMPPKVNAQPALWEANAPAAPPNPWFAPIFTSPVRKTPVLTQEDVENGSPALRQFQQGLDLVQPGLLKGVARGVGGMIDQTFNTPAGLASLPVFAAGGLPAKALGYGFLGQQAAESKAPATVLGTEMGKNPEDRDRTKMGGAGFNLGLPLAAPFVHPTAKLAINLGAGVAELGRQIKDPEGYFSDPLHGAYGGRGAPEFVGSLQWTGLRAASVSALAKQVKGVDTAELHNGLADLQRTDRFPNLVQAYKAELLNRGETPVETPVDPKTVQLKPATASPVINWVRQQEKKLGLVPTPVTRRAGILSGRQQLQSGKPTGVLPPVPLTSITPTANQATGLPSQQGATSSFENDERLHSESTEALVARTQVGVERDTAFAERAAARKRLELSLKPGDVVIDEDGGRHIVTENHPRYGIMTYKEGTTGNKTGLPREFLHGERIERSKQNANQTTVPTVQLPTPQPPVAETKPVQQAKPQVSKEQQTFLHTLKAVGESIKSGARKGVFTPEEAKSLTQRGDAIFAERIRSNDLTTANKNAETFYNELVARHQQKGQNANAGTTEPITPTPPAVQGQKAVGQEGQAGKKVVPAQGQLQSTPQKEIPGGVGGVPGSAGTGNVQGVRPAGVNAPKPVSMAKWNKMTPEERTAQQWHEVPEWDVQKKHLGEAGFFHLFGGVDLSPLGWKSEARVQGDQAYNRIRNVLGAGSGAFQHLEDNGLKAFLATPKTVTELKNWMTEVGPKLGTHVYGMEGKVSEAKKEYDKMTHEWYDALPWEQQTAVRQALDSRKPEAQQAMVNLLEPKMAEVAQKYIALDRQVKAEPKDTSPRATSAYSRVSAFPTNEPMPEWTTTKSGNVQRVDVVVPEKGESYEGWLKRHPNYADNELSRKNYEEDHKYVGDHIKWRPDNTHENLPNTLGWAMIQYTDAASVLKKYGHTLDEASIKILKANPDAKIGVIAEAQSAWAQSKRAYDVAYDQAKKAGKTDGEAHSAGMMAEGNRRQYTPEKNHTLLKDYNRLILKAAIEQARKEGATHIMVSDAETAMMTEGQDVVPTVPRETRVVYENNDRESVASKHNTLQEQNPNKSYTISNDGKQVLEVMSVGKKEITQEPGMRLNYDNILPKITEELTGSKGERVSLGEHKNAFDQAYDNGWHSVPRSNLIFRNPNGTPKTDISGRIYPIKHVDPSKFTTFGKDKASSSVQLRDRTGEAGSIFPKTSGGVGPRFGKNKDDLLTDLKQGLANRGYFKGISVQNKQDRPNEKGMYMSFPATGKEYLVADRNDTETALHETVHAFTHNNKDTIVASAEQKLSIDDKKDLAKIVKSLGFSYRIHAEALEKAIINGKSNAGLWRSIDELTAQASNRRFWNNGPWTVDKAYSILTKVYGEDFADFLRGGEITQDQYYPKWNQKTGEYGAIFPETHGGKGPSFGPSRRALEERDEAPEPGEWPEVGDALARGRALISQGTDPEKVLSNFLKDPEKMVSEDMIGVLFAHGADLAKKTADAADAHGVTSPEFKAAAKVERDWVERSRPPATAAGRTLQALQGQVDLDTGSVYSMVKRLSEGTDKEPTEAQVKYIEETAKASKEADAKVALKWQELQQRLDTLSKQLAEEQARPKVASKSASEILAMAAQHGVKGAGKALQGLNALFGTGTGRLGSGPTFDEKTWAAAKPLFQEAWNEWKAAGKDLGHFAQVALDTWGEKVQPYVERFVTEQGGKASKPTATAVKVEPTTEAVRKTVTSKPAKSRGDLETAAVWEYAKRKYLEIGETDFDTIRHGIAQDLGLTADEVGRILTRNSSVKVLSDEMYAAMDARRKLKQSAEFWLQDQKTPGWAKAVRMVPRVFFLDKIFGHGTVGMITHAGINVFNPGAWSTYFPSFLRQYKLAYSHTFHEQWVQDQVRKPNFVMWKRAGLKCDPYRYPDDYQNATIKAFFGKLNMVVGNYGFDALKDFRINRANQLWNKLPAELRLDENGKTNRKMAQMVADSVNHATGIVHMPFREWASYTFFAPRLEASRWAWAMGDPAKAVVVFKNWKNASPEDKAFAMAEFKQKAAVAGTYIAALMLNQGVLSMMGSDKKVNYTDPKKSDFLAFKVAGHKVGVVGPLLGMVHLFVELCHDAISTRGKLESLTPRGKEMGEDIWQYGRGKVSPFAGFGLDIASQGDYAGRPLPWSQDKPSKNEPQLSYKEYGLSTFLPIPFEEALKEVWSEQGMDEGTMQKAFKFLGIAAGAGGTGVRIQPDNQPKPPSPPPEKNPFKVPSIHGIKPPKALSMGDIINRPQGNFQVVDFDQDGHPLVEPV